MKLSSYLSSLVLVVATAALAAPSPAPGSLEADLKAIKTPKWPVQVSFVGWTTDHRAVYRSLVCDQDAGGGRGPYCELNLCVTKLYADTEASSAAMQGQCTLLLSLDLNNAKRDSFKDADVVTATTAALGKLGTLDPGKVIANSGVRTSNLNHVLTLTRKVKGADQKVVMYPYADRDDGGRVQTTKDIKLASVVASPDGKCMVALGKFVFASHYEAVATATPMTFAKIMCD